MASTKKNMLLFSIQNFTLDFTLHREVVLKCVSFLNCLKDEYNFYLLDFDMICDTSDANEFYVVKGKKEVTVTSYYEEIKNIIPIKGLVKLSLKDEIQRMSDLKSTKTHFIHNFDIEFDTVYSFNHYISPNFNKVALDKKLPYKVLNLFVLNNPQYHKFIFFQYAKYLILNSIFKDYSAQKLQFISDPLDLKMDNFIRLSPDSQDEEVHKQNNTVFGPIYQYHYFIYSKPQKQDKELHFVIGNTLYNDTRIKVFNHYLEDLYAENRTNPEYRWHLSGYMLKDEDNSFVDYNEFYANVERAKYTLVLNTYAENIMSANKVSLMISRDCVPFICKGADEGSNFFSKELLQDLEVTDAESMRNKLYHSDYDGLNKKIQEEFAYYKDPEYYKQVFSKYF